jgi:hypothetical protein
MSLEQWSYLAQIIAAFGVVASLVFVGLEIRHNTAVLYRNEHNSTMAQWTVIRMAIVRHRDVAELMTAGLHGTRALDAADQLRLEHFLNEHAWAGFHIWDRTQRGVFAKGTFEATAGPLLADILSTGQGAAWWSRAKGTYFPPDYAGVVDAVLSGRADPPGGAG